jgi:quercetin dioxygenase-like cupin family protein
MWKRISFAFVFLVAAAAATTSHLPEMRMTPAEVLSGGAGDSQIGSSKLAGVHTKVLFGEPAKAGFYSILLFVPPHTTIQAHSHRDDRVATVVSGEWHFGYGTHFDERSLKALAPGSVYSEPGGDNHFAQTGDDPVVVQISGYGPTDTRYFNPADDPEAGSKQKK